MSIVFQLLTLFVCLFLFCFFFDWSSRSDSRFNSDSVFHVVQELYRYKNCTSTGAPINLLLFIFVLWKSFHSQSYLFSSALGKLFFNALPKTSFTQQPEPPWPCPPLPALWLWLVLLAPVLVLVFVFVFVWDMTI